MKGERSRWPSRPIRLLDLYPIALESAGLIHDRLLFDLVREQLVNAAKHAQPRTVRVSIGRSHDVITMEVSDDGSGTSEGRLQEAITQGHVGLASSEERVVALGGSLSVRSEPRTGTLVTTTLPVDAVAV